MSRPPLKPNNVIIYSQLLYVNPAIASKGVVPIAWGENGFREITNSQRPIHRPADLVGLKFRVVGAPIFVDAFRAVGANPISLSWDEALVALQREK